MDKKQQHVHHSELSLQQHLPFDLCPLPFYSFFAWSTGLLTFYCLLVVFYMAGIGLYAHRVWITISKGGPMHDVRQNSETKATSIKADCLVFLFAGSENALCCYDTAFLWSTTDVDTPLEVWA